MRLVALSDDRLRNSLGIGVAGNFAGHLEQAGEDRDFVRVSALPEAPKGIFPFYAPGAASFLGTYPISHDRIAWTTSGDLQIEPELAVLCEINYLADRSVGRLRPQIVAAFNDCSARRPNAEKISEKKNWGTDSKGIAARGFEISEIARDGVTANLRIACFMRRNGSLSTYGVDSAVVDYSFYGETLLDWIAACLREQRDEGGSPLEDVGELLGAAGHPTSILIAVGATRYTTFGETNFLLPGDQSVVIVYDGSVQSSDNVRDAVAHGSESELEAASVLCQTVS